MIVFLLHPENLSRADRQTGSGHDYYDYYDYKWWVNQPFWVVHKLNSKKPSIPLINKNKYHDYPLSEARAAGMILLFRLGDSVFPSRRM